MGGKGVRRGSAHLCSARAYCQRPRPGPPPPPPPHRFTPIVITGTPSAPATALGPCTRQG